MDRLIIFVWLLGYIFTNGAVLQLNKKLKAGPWWFVGIVNMVAWPFVLGKIWAAFGEDK